MPSRRMQARVELVVNLLQVVGLGLSVKHHLVILRRRLSEQNRIRNLKERASGRILAGYMALKEQKGEGFVDTAIKIPPPDRGNGFLRHTGEGHILFPAWLPLAALLLFSVFLPFPSPFRLSA